jgi:hypothetical protein
MFTLYKVVCISLYLFLSMVLLYHRLPRRWMKFSAGFLALYCIGSYFFFERMPFNIPPEYQDSMPQFLFFFGVLGCIGICLYRQLTPSQTFGLILGYLFIVSFLIFIVGKNMNLLQEISIKEFLISAPFVLFIVGIPLIAGYCFYRQLCLWEAIGACAVFCSLMILSIIATTSFFHQPVSSLNPQIKALIQQGSLLVFAFGIPSTFGYCLWNQLTAKQTIGVMFVFFGLMTALITTIWLTIGYESVVIVFSRIFFAER